MFLFLFLFYIPLFAGCWFLIDYINKAISKERYSRRISVIIILITTPFVFYIITMGLLLSASWIDSGNESM